MKEELEDFSELTSIDTPLESGELRKMMMAFMIVPVRLVKLKRLVDNLYRKEKKDV